MADDSAPRYSYEQLAEELRGEIARGQRAPGAKLPSIRDLGARSGLAPQTVKSALTVLHDEGLIYADSTRGYFVADDAREAAGRAGAATRDYATVVQQVDDLTGRVRELAARVEELTREVADLRETRRP